MNIGAIFRPKPTLTEHDLDQGLRMMTWEGITSLGFGSITTSGFLAAFALALGANNLQIGVLAAIPFITQPLQIPTILLVERLRLRKAISVTTWSVAQLLWIPIALIPVFLSVPGAAAMSVLLGLMAARGVLAAATNCAWNGWVRDLVPQQVLGRFFSRRLALATLVAAGFGLLAALFVDYWRERAAEADAVFGYTIVLFGGAVLLGLASPVFMSRMPEPLMQPALGAQPSLLRVLATPFRDKNFRQLMNFLLFSGFALNLAVPFFAVYMLQRLGLPLSGVIGLSVLSQLTNVVFLRLWGPLADRFGSKIILSLSSSLYLLVVLGWAFTTMPERYTLTIPLLVILHIFAGAAAAGVTLTVGTIGLKLAPQGQSTAYLAGASLATNLGAGLGPLAGGLFADFFSVRALTVDFTWTGPTQVLQIPAVHLTGYDFLFAFTFIIGLLALNTLTTIREEGEVSRDVVLEELMAQSRQISRAVSSVPGLRFVAQFPFSYLRHVPGMDVALGVTAYQLAEVTRVVIRGTVHGVDAATEIAGRMSNAVSELAEQAEALGEHGRDLARHAIRGAVHAARGFPDDLGRVVRESVKGMLDALSQAPLDLEQALYGIGYGAAQGGSESGADLGEVAAQAVEGAREASGGLDLSEEEAALKVAEGLLGAAEALGPDSVAQVREALPREIEALTSQEAEADEEGKAGPG